MSLLPSDSRPVGAAVVRAAGLVLVLLGALLAALGMGQQGLVNIAQVLGTAVALIVPGVGILAKKGLPNRAERKKILLFVALATSIVIVAGDTISEAPGLSNVSYLQLLRATNGEIDVLYLHEGGGIGYCSRPPTYRPGSFSKPRDTRWPEQDGTSAFDSDYNGIEILGQIGGQLYFGYRDTNLEWHSPAQVMINGAGVYHARGRPAFIQDDRRGILFVALLPEDSGIGIYERTDYRDPGAKPWSRDGTMAGSAGVVDSVAAIDYRGGLIVVERRGLRLFLTVQKSGTLPGNPTKGWSSLIPIESQPSFPQVSGDPQLYLLQESGSRPSSRMFLAVPTIDGPVLLSGDPAHPFAPWQLSRPPVHLRTSVASVLVDSAHGYQYYEMAFVAYGRAYLSLSLDGAETWLPAKPLACGRLTLEP
jgi:hypothetical protein